MKKPMTLTQAYVISLLLLVMWAVFAYLTMNQQIETQEKYAQLINISGKQRMLSQRTALLADHFLSTGDPEFLVELGEHYKQMVEDHQFLINHLPSDAISAIYFKPPHRLAEKSRSYFELLAKFQNSPDLFTTMQIYLQTSQLLPLLDHAVSVYEEESDRNTLRLIHLEGYILCGTLLTLLLEALFIVRPALLRANLNMKNLQQMVGEQTEALDIYKKIFASSNDGIVVTDADNRIVDVNPSFSRITGYARGEVVGETPAILKSTHQDDTFYKDFWTSLSEEGHWSGEFINRKKDGSIYYQLTYAFVLRDEQEQIRNHVGIMSDVSGIKEDKNRLEYLALYDMLTDLPNRTFLTNQVRKALERSRRYHHKLAIILIDLDNFKTINDTLTHRVGDMVLKKIGRILTDATRNLDTVARIGGDEFVMLIEEIHDENSLITIMEKIQQCLEEPVRVDKYQLHITCSMGVAIFPDDARTYDNLLQFADTAMYHAKSSGKNQFSFFTKELNAAVQEKIKIETALKTAVARDEFQLVFQPIMALEDNSIVAFEALLRWHNASLDDVSPDKFIPVAEALGQIRMIDCWVLAEVRNVLRAADCENLCITVNISSKHFSHKNFLNEINQIFSGSQIRGQIVLEITETAIVENIEHTKTVFSALKDQGFRIAIDDFGTGYSSLYYLKHLPLDLLKIDKSFVMDMEKEVNDRIIVDSILSMAGSLGLGVVAEGIETVGQWRYLHDSGQCRYGQGYYLGKPLPLDDMLQQVKDVSRIEC